MWLTATLRRLNSVAAASGLKAAFFEAGGRADIKSITDLFFLHLATGRLALALGHNGGDL